jgi:hypothetical protein
MLSNIKPYSPTPERDFVWVVEYSNGTFLSEYDYSTKEKNDFNTIRKQDVIRFGLFGHGFKFYYETFGGHFKTPFGMIDFVYKTKDKEYALTGQNVFYNDLITYKRGVATFNPLYGQREASTVIDEYVFGYKQKLSFDDIDLNFKALFKIPFNAPMYMTIRLVANQDIEGILQIKRGGIAVDEIDFSLIKNLAREHDWMVS